MRRGLYANLDRAKRSPFSQGCEAIMHQESMLLEILALIAVAVAAATLFSRLGLGTILGYLVGGMLIGPWGIGLIQDAQQIAYLGEFGVIFLLFLIGIELKPARLWVMRKQVFGLGSAQLVVTGLVLFGAAHLLLGIEAGQALLIGLGLALSSTAFGVQFLAAKNQLATQWGRSGFAILLMQDLAVVPLLALVPLLAGGEVTLGASFGIALLEAIVILIGVIFIGRIAINPLFRLVAAIKTPEVFTGFALLLVLGFGWLMEHIGLSMAMGAFIAGLLMAESEFRHQAEIDIMPFRGLLLGLFFMSVGMGINFNTLADLAGPIAAALILILIIKAIAIVGLTRFMGLSLPESIKTGTLLAQAGEFGFVIFNYAKLEGVLEGQVVEALMAIIALSMAVTPLLFSLGIWLSRRMVDEQAAQLPTPEKNEDANKQVIVAGFGRVGTTVARILSELKIPFTAVDLDPGNIKRARDAGFRAIYGDAARPEILRALGAEKAALLLVTVDDPKAAERIILSTKRTCPHLPTYVRTHNPTAARALKALGATHTVPETLEASLSLGAEVARAFDVKEESIRDILKSLRADDYHELIPCDAPDQS